MSVFIYLRSIVLPKRQWTIARVRKIFVHVFFFIFSRVHPNDRMTVFLRMKWVDPRLAHVGTVTKKNSSGFLSNLKLNLGMIFSNP